MKKLIIILLFSVGLQAQNSTFKCEPIKLGETEVASYYPVLLQIELKKFKIEIDGHLIKFPVYLKATLDGIEIYDKNNKHYQKRNCEVHNCNIIHLETKKTGIVTYKNWENITLTPNVN